MNNDEFMCVCDVGYQWNNRTQTCEYISNCLFKFCDKNEICEEDRSTKQALCRCKQNYFRDEKTNKCEYDLCKQLPEEKRCPKNEKCVTVLGEKERRCICPLENRMEDDVCLDEKYVDNPLIKQYYDCSHTYKIVDNEVVCACYAGYQLDSDRKTCVGDLTERCATKCSPTQICALNEGTNRYECRCQLGFYGPDCLIRDNYCEKASLNELQHICGYGSCVVKKHRGNRIGFSCNCDRHTSMHDESNGLCQLKDVCDEKTTKKCADLNAACIPRIDRRDSFLYEICQCSRGWDQSREEDKCKKACELGSSIFSKIDTYKDYCQIDFKANQRLWVCRPGFLWNSTDEKCYAGQNLLKIDFDFKYRNLETEVTELEPPLEFSTEDYYCENSSDKIACIQQLNLNRLKEHRVLEDDFLDSLKYKISNSFKESIKNLIKPSAIKAITFDKLESKGEIDYSNDGLNSIYSIEMYIEIDQTVTIDVIKQNLEKVCVKDDYNLDGLDEDANDGKVERVVSDEKGKSEDKKEEKESVEKRRNKHCVIRPYIYLINSELKIKEFNLCDFMDDKLGINCNGNSNCLVNQNNSRSRYECKCSSGFYTRFTTKEQGIKFNACTDIDECVDPKLNTCDEATTNCENLLGSFRCDCKENYKRVNNTHCECKSINDSL